MEPEWLLQFSDPTPDMVYGWMEKAFNDLDVTQTLNEQRPWTANRM